MTTRSLSAKHTRVPLRLLGGSLIVAIELPEAMTEKSWLQMMGMLEALKPGYVPEPHWEDTLARELARREEQNLDDA